jgi:hypothetical protein
MFLGKIDASLPVGSEWLSSSPGFAFLNYEIDL